MIKIKISKDEITVKGHSGYGLCGSDIVCSAVSSICITTVNAILSIYEDCITYEIDDGYLKINIIKHNKIVDSLINNMINLLNEVKDQYKENVTIE